MPPRVRPPLHRGPANSAATGDAGFTVLECLVSFVVLAVVGIASVFAVVDATRTDNSSANRTVAANLAQSDQNAAQALRYPNYPAAVSTKSVVVGTTTYSISRTVTYACPSTPNYTTNPFMVVTTTVKWPPGGSGNQVIVSQELAC